MQSSAPRTVRLPVAADFAYARDVIPGNLAPTPLIDGHSDGTPAWLKLESMQPTGSFKVRGALTAMSAVQPGQRVLAVSAGNHALGIAWSSQRTGIPATIVIAETASPAKRAKLEALPITLVRHGDSYDAAEAYAVDLASRQDADTVFISAYNDPLVIAGQATIVDEIAAQAPAGQPLTILVPASGGGLLAGVALRAEAFRQQGREVRVIGVETEASTAMSTSLAAGRVVDVTVLDSVADGLSGNIEPGSVTVDLVKGRIEGMVQVSEPDIFAAMGHLLTHHGVVAEGAGAATTAAVLAGHAASLTGTVVAIVSGRNVTRELLQRALAK